MPAPEAVLADIDLSGCARLYIDGGSNMGEGVKALLNRNLHRCAMASPSRLYGRAWNNASGAQKRAWMQPLAEPHTWCVVSLDAAPGVAVELQARGPGRTSSKATDDRAEAGALPRVQYVDAALGVSSARSATRRIVRYSSHTPWGLTHSTFAHRDIHANFPPALEEFTTHGRTIGVRDLMRKWSLQVPRAEAGGRPAGALALRLDVEGAEFAILDELASDPATLCEIDYLFVEYHNLKCATHAAAPASPPALHRDTCFLRAL